MYVGAASCSRREGVTGRGARDARGEGERHYGGDPSRGRARCIQGPGEEEEGRGGDVGKLSRQAGRERARGGEMGDDARPHEGARVADGAGECIAKEDGGEGWHGNGRTRMGEASGGCGASDQGFVVGNICDCWTWPLRLNPLLD